jgi:hypothetical protein
MNRTGEVTDVLGTSASMAQTGLMLGGPHGAAIGAAVGAGVGIYQASAKRKAQKRQDKRMREMSFESARQQMEDLSETKLNGYPTKGIIKSSIF